MTDDRDNYAALLDDASSAVHQARDNLNTGPSTGTVRDAVDDIDASVREVERQIDHVQNNLGELRELIALADGADSAFDSLDEAVELLRILGDEMDADDEVTGTLTIGEQTYDVRLTRHKDATDDPEQDDEADDKPEGLGDLFG